MALTDVGLDLVIDDLDLVIGAATDDVGLATCRNKMLRRTLRAAPWCAR